MITLYSYQKTANDQLRQSVARLLRDNPGRGPAVCYVGPTGSGKTTQFASIAHLAAQKHKRVVVLAPRRELINQAAERIREFGTHVDMVMPGVARNVSLPTKVVSWDTLTTRMRNGRMDLPIADILIVDECHLATSPKRKAIIEQYRESGAIVLGFTATPCTGTGKGLGKLFDDLIEGPTLASLIHDDHLVPVRYFAPSKPDLATVKVQRGDYQGKALSEKMDCPQLIGDIVTNWERIAPDRQTVVFCVDRRHARHVAEKFTERGHRAEYLDGETPTEDRAAILEQIATGETRVVVSVMVLTYGVDIPALSCAILARPTKSVVLYLQAIGRTLRTAGKKDAIVIDHSGCIDEHGFVEQEWQWSLDAGETVTKRTERKRAERGEPKEITCGDCGTVFTMRRDCPDCGHEMIPASRPIPTYQADLDELPASANRATSWPEKIRFIGELKRYALTHDYADGWTNNQYRARFAVWPNDPRVRYADPAVSIRPETASWIKSRQIAYAKRRTAA